MKEARGYDKRRGEGEEEERGEGLSRVCMVYIGGKMMRGRMDG